MNKSAFLLLLLIASCSTPSEVIGPETLIQVDKDFSKMSEDKGMAEAFIYYADEDVVKLGQGTHPILGKSQLTEEFSSIDDSKIRLTWQPTKAEIAKSGDLGYTYGKYYFTATDSVETTSTGYYVSVWKKQQDGSWKYVLDGGAEGPIE